MLMERDRPGPDPERTGPTALGFVEKGRFGPGVGVLGPASPPLPTHFSATFLCTLKDKCSFRIDLDFWKSWEEDTGSSINRPTPSFPRYQPLTLGRSVCPMGN